MACLDDNLLAAYLDARLGEADTAAMLAHVDGCARCAKLLEQVAATKPPVTLSEDAAFAVPADHSELPTIDLPLDEAGLRDWLRSAAATP